MHGLPVAVISRYSNTYAKKRKRLGIRVLPQGRLKRVISTYSSILLSVSMINIANMRACVRPCRRASVRAGAREARSGSPEGERSQ